MHKNNLENSENNILTKKWNLCREIYSRPPVYQIWRIYLDLRGHDCKKWVWPSFGCKLGQSDPIVMQFKLDMLCHLLNVYTKFQINISKHVEEKSGKHGRRDGWTNRRTDTATAYVRFSNGHKKTQRILVKLTIVIIVFVATCKTTLVKQLQADGTTASVKRLRVQSLHMTTQLGQSEYQFPSDVTNLKEQIYVCMQVH